MFQKHSIVMNTRKQFKTIKFKIYDIE